MIETGDRSRAAVMLNALRAIVGIWSFPLSEDQWAERLPAVGRVRSRRFQVVGVSSQSHDVRS